MSDNELEQALQQVGKLHSAQLATYLGNSGDPRAVDALLEALQTQPTFLTPHEPVFRFYAVRALGKLGDIRALPLLMSIQKQETEPILQGRSIGDMAHIAIQRIQTPRK